ncbi:hypothetical protein D3C80_2053580 [compost metagenome]
MLEVLPNSMRTLAVATFAADWACSESNHSLYGEDSSSRTYSTTFIINSNLYVTLSQSSKWIQLEAGNTQRPGNQVKHWLLQRALLLQVQIGR